QRRERRGSLLVAASACYNVVRAPNAFQMPTTPTGESSHVPSPPRRACVARPSRLLAAAASRRAVARGSSDTLAPALFRRPNLQGRRTFGKERGAAVEHAAVGVGGHAAGRDLRHQPGFPPSGGALSSGGRRDGGAAPRGQRPGSDPQSAP